jgi:hypothetical protein
MKRSDMCRRSTTLLVFVSLLSWLPARPCVAKPPSTQPVGEKVPSEDAVLKDLHSMGLINGCTNIFRCACPVRDIAKQMATTQPSAADLAAGKQRMQRLYDLGIRTVISFQNPLGDDDHPKEVARAVALEKQTAAEVGLQYVAYPISNAGKNSLQDMSDQAVLNLLDPISVAIFKYAQTGGVAFHCSAGHDRTGIVAAYLRLKYEHWPVEQAIDEMRRYGHNWPKFSSNGGISSWHEDHLRAIAKMIESGNP